MKVYILSFSTATNDPSTWRDHYTKAAKPVLAKHGAKIIGVGQPQNLERGSNWERAALIEFPSIEAVHAFHDDPEYSAAREMRIANTEGEMYLLSMD